MDHHDPSSLTATVAAARIAEGALSPGDAARRVPRAHRRARSRARAMVRDRGCERSSATLSGRPKRPRWPCCVSAESGIESKHGQPTLSPPAAVDSHRQGRTCDASRLEDAGGLGARRAAERAGGLPEDLRRGAGGGREKVVSTGIDSNDTHSTAESYMGAIRLLRTSERGRNSPPSDSGVRERAEVQRREERAVALVGEEVAGVGQAHPADRVDLVLRPGRARDPQHRPVANDLEPALVVNV